MGIPWGGHCEGLWLHVHVHVDAASCATQVFDVDDNGRVDHREFSSLVFPDIWGLDPGQDPYYSKEATHTKALEDMKILKRSCTTVFQLHAAAAESRESGRQLQAAGAPPQAPSGKQTAEVEVGPITPGSGSDVERLGAVGEAGEAHDAGLGGAAASTAAAEGELVLEARRQAEYIRQLKEENDKIRALLSGQGGDLSALTAQSGLPNEALEAAQAAAKVAEEEPAAA